MPDEREPAGSHHLRANEQVRAASGPPGAFFFLHQFTASEPACEVAAGASSLCPRRRSSGDSLSCCTQPGDSYCSDSVSVSTLSLFNFSLWRLRAVIISSLS